MTVFNPGQIPPQVTMPARVSLGSKKSFSRGPASSKRSSSGGVTPGVRTICNGTRASSLTECRIGDAKRALPSKVMFADLFTHGRLQLCLERFHNFRVCGVDFGVGQGLVHGTVSEGIGQALLSFRYMLAAKHVE